MRSQTSSCRYLQQVHRTGGNKHKHGDTNQIAGAMYEGHMDTQVLAGPIGKTPQLQLSSAHQEAHAVQQLKCQPPQQQTTTTSNVNGNYYFFAVKPGRGGLWNIW